jgi:hypothetical protein
MKGNPVIVDIDELMKQEEMLSENRRKADEWFIETLRQRAFPTPSPFGPVRPGANDWCKQAK